MDILINRKNARDRNLWHFPFSSLLRLPQLCYNNFSKKKRREEEKNGRTEEKQNKQQPERKSLIFLQSNCIHKNLSIIYIRGIIRSRKK